MKTFITSDQHYKHADIAVFCNRPFQTVKDMNKQLITNHNSVVGENDTVYHLGDFCFTSGWQDVKNILNQLNGKHHLILGNHDRLNVFDYVEAGFIYVHTSLLLDGYVLIHDPAVAGVFPQMRVIHGHTHNLALRLGNNSYCCCVELHNYTPVDFEYIKENW